MRTPLAIRLQHEREEFGTPESDAAARKATTLTRALLDPHKHIGTRFSRMSTCTIDCYTVCQIKIRKHKIELRGYAFCHIC